MRLFLVGIVCWTLFATRAGASGPFTAAPTLTLAAEIDSMAMAAIVKRVTPAAKVEFGEVDSGKVDFVVESVIKGDKLARVGQKLTVTTFSEGNAGDLYLLLAQDEKLTKWTTPLRISPRAPDYLLKLGSLPKEGPDRLKFFYTHFEDQDELLARDAFDEFEEVSFATLQKLKPVLQHDQLVKWIQDHEIPASRKRLYYRLLSICGSDRDLPLLESVFKSTNRKDRSGLDAAIDCYLVLHGAEGLPLVEGLFIRNKKADYADTYSAILALRLHVNERHSIPREKTIASLRLMLQRLELADLVIPDLAKWEDWSVVDEVFTAFKNSTEETKWVRVPAIQYLRRCPLEKAKEHLKACERIDPHSIQKANEQITRERKP